MAVDPLLVEGELCSDELDSSSAPEADPSADELSSDEVDPSSDPELDPPPLPEVDPSFDELSLDSVSLDDGPSSRFELALEGSAAGAEASGAAPL